MPVLNPRTRLVYFRISEAEFQQIQQQCVISGARSISEVARIAVQKYLAESEHDSREMTEAWEALGALVADLKTVIAQLTALIAVSGGKDPTHTVTHSNASQ